MDELKVALCFSNLSQHLSLSLLSSLVAKLISSSRELVSSQAVKSSLISSNRPIKKTP